MKRRTLLFVLLLILVVGAVVAADWWIALPEGRSKQYVGRDTCARCHAEQLARWTGSDHDLAMEMATPKTVLGNFDDQKFEHLGVKSRFFREGDNFLVITEGADGKPGTFQVKYTFGVRPLQQYLVEFDDGRVQCLPMAWDTKEKALV